MSEPNSLSLHQLVVGQAQVKLQDLRALVQSMSQWRQSPESGVYLMVVCLSGALPENKRTNALVDSVLQAISPIALRRGASVYQVSSVDFALLVKTSELSILSLVRDIKVDVLRAIDRLYPGTFGSIDQSRLALSYDLAADYRSAAARIAKFSEVAAAPASDPTKKRGLTEADIQKVTLAYSKFGSDKFVKAFVKSQDVVLRDAGGYSSKISEFYFSIDLIRKPLFVDVDMRGSGRLFNEFTLTLDQIMLGSVGLLPECPGPWSLNLNVETIFTEPFETFLANTPPEKLKNFYVEFRQANIMENFDEFQVALGLIKAKGAGIIVDQVFPPTAGLVDLSELSANYCKIHWQDGSEEILRQRKRAIAHMQDSNVTPILVRVDAPRAFEIAEELGINLFQGHLVDEMRKTAAA